MYVARDYRRRDPPTRLRSTNATIVTTTAAAATLPPSQPPTHLTRHLRPLHAGPRGTFTSTSGEDECTVCEPGRVAVTTGSTNCSLCPSGTFLEAVDEGEDEPSRHDDLSDCNKCECLQRASYAETGGRPSR